MNPVTQSSAESNAEAKIAREVVCVSKATKPEKDKFDSLLERTTLRRTLRVLAWVDRFISNSRRHEKRSGPLDMHRRNRDGKDLVNQTDPKQRRHRASL